MEISLPILDWIRQFFAKLGLLGSIFVPAGITAICVALYFAISRTKTTRKLEKTTPIHETAETEGMKLEGLSQQQTADSPNELEAENEEMQQAFSQHLPEGLSIKPPPLKFNGNEDENQRMIDSSFAYYVSMALINSAPSARIHTEVKSKYGEIRTIHDETLPPDFKGIVKDALRELNDEIEKEQEKNTPLSAEPQPPAPIEDEIEETE